MGRNLYKVIIMEQESYTTYIFAKNEEEAKEKAIFTDIQSKANQDFEQKIIKIDLLKKKDYPIGTALNE